MSYRAKIDWPHKQTDCVYCSVVTESINVTEILLSLKYFVVQCSTISERNLLFFAVSQTSSVCLSGKSNMQMKVIMEHCWSGTDSWNLKYSGINLSQCHFVDHISLMDWHMIESSICVIDRVHPYVSPTRQANRQAWEPSKRSLKRTPCRRDSSVGCY
jgi:hypothetical protein